VDLSGVLRKAQSADDASISQNWYHCEVPLNRQDAKDAKRNSRENALGGLGVLAVQISCSVRRDAPIPTKFFLCYEFEVMSDERCVKALFF
jgi:hypothetical protein